MITETIEITRGAGVFQHPFDFANAMPPKQVFDNEQWLIRIENLLIPIVTKRSNKAGGSDDEILLNEGADTVTIILAEDERNAIPDAGYSYRLFYVNQFGDWEEMAAGAITNEGDPPIHQEEDVVKIEAINASNVRNVSQNFNFHVLDDYVYANTTPANIIGVLPNANAFRNVKRYFLKNKGTGTLTINTHLAATVIVLAAEESVKVASKGSVWEVLFTGVGELP